MQSYGAEIEGRANPDWIYPKAAVLRVYNCVGWLHVTVWEHSHPVDRKTEGRARRWDLWSSIALWNEEPQVQPLKEAYTVPSNGAEALFYQELWWGHLFQVSRGRARRVREANVGWKRALEIRTIWTSDGKEVDDFHVKLLKAYPAWQRRITQPSPVGLEDFDPTQPKHALRS